jgi:hypothetical protein
MATEPDRENSFKCGIRICIALAVIFVILGFVAAFIGYRPPRADDNFLNDLGNFGSYLQGTTASFWSLAGLLIIFVAFLAQKQQLMRQEIELKNQEKQFDLQQQSIKLQNFENSFFQLLNLHNQNVSQMRISVEQFASVSSNEYDGRKCFQILHNLLHAVYGTRTAEQSADVKHAAEFYSRMFDVYQASLGHYFRTLYHVIKFVDESEALKLENADADKNNRRRYTSLVRAQLSAFELELLFYNGISPYGEKFKPLIEKYGLLENFNTAHLLSPKHEDFYAKAAFE